MAKTGKQLIINWPLRWYPSHITAKRLVDEGKIHKLLQVHYYDGNRGPLYHLADKVEVSDEEVRKGKPDSWFYRREAGGGSLLDYVGYGVTLGSWFMNGEKPIEVTCIMDEPEGLEVDEHSVTVCRYKRGLSKFETRWGTLTDPWTQQPQPKCGFLLLSAETAASQATTTTTTSRCRRVGTPSMCRCRSINCRPAGAGSSNTCSPVSRTTNRSAAARSHALPDGQRMIDSAVLSAAEKRTVALVP